MSSRREIDARAPLSSSCASGAAGRCDGCLRSPEGRRVGGLGPGGPVPVQNQ